MRKNLTILALLLVLLVSACSPQSAVPTASTTEPQATTEATEAPATTEAASTPAASTPAASTPSGSTPSGAVPSGSTPSASGTQAATPSAGGQVPVTGLGTEIRTAEFEGLGLILVDAIGLPLYIYQGDSQGSDTSACTEDCILGHPPVITVGDPVAGEGVDASLLGIIQREIGLLQVTYNGWPLYRFTNDAVNRGEATGQGEGRQWYVIGADGNPITTAAPDTSATDGATTTQPAATSTPQ